MLVPCLGQNQNAPLSSSSFCFLDDQRFASIIIRREEGERGEMKRRRIESDIVGVEITPEVYWNKSETVNWITRINPRFESVGQLWNEIGVDEEMLAYILLSLSFFLSHYCCYFV